MKSLAGSDHIAGTVRTHLISSSRISIAIDFSISCKWSRRALMDAENTSIAGSDCPRTSSIVVFNVRFYKVMKL
jgi:hypothetical protein